MPQNLALRPKRAIAIQPLWPYADIMEAPASFTLESDSELRPSLAASTSKPNKSDVNPSEVKKSTPKKPKGKWFLPVTVAATGIAGFAVLMTRGCWHRKMSWPLTVQGCSYRVCLGCGIKRLFDEPSFTSYGPYSYDLNKLTAWDQKRRQAAMPKAS